MNRPARPRPTSPPPRRASGPSPNDLLGAAAAVLTNDEPVLDGRRAVTAAALTRQAVESALDAWLGSRGATGSRSSRRDDFLCLGALHPHPDLARQLHQVWARLSDACHANSYDLPPTSGELQRWMQVVHRFIESTDEPA